MSHKILVITGSKKQFRRYRRERGVPKNSEDILRVRNEGQLLGIEADTELVLYGEWWLNPVMKTWTYRYITVKGPWEK